MRNKYKVMRFPTIALALSTLICPAAGAQCPDGSPPPCGVKRTTVVSSRPSPPSGAARARRFLLLPFKNVTRIAAQDWLVTGAPMMLGAALGQYQNLEVVPDEKLTAALRRASLPTDVAPDAAQLRGIAEETGGWTAISGSVLNTGGKLHLTVQALDIVTTKVLTRAEGDVAADADVRVAFDTLAARLLTVTGLSSEGGVDLGALTTRSVPAYRAYVNGMDAMRRMDGRAASAAFGEAVKLDSTFTVAWARLGMSLVLWDNEALSDPSGTAFRAVDRASRATRPLPAREARLIRAMQHSFSGRMGAARAVLDSAVAADPTDLEAREYLALTEMRDFLLTDTSVAHPRMRGSRNHAVKMFEGILERDPTRGSTFHWLAVAYSELIGGLGGQPGLPGLRTEAPSLSALANPTNYIPVVPVVRDSIELMSLPAWYSLSEAEKRAFYARAAERGRFWTDRWIAAAPRDAQAHSDAFLFAYALGDYERAVKESDLFLAESPSGSSIDFLLARARALLAVNRAREATLLADSLRSAGNVPAKSIDGLVRVGLAALLLQKRWDDVARLADVTAARSPIGTPPCAYFWSLLSADWGGALPTVVRTAIMDTVAVHLVDMTSRPRIAACGTLFAIGLRTDSLTIDRTRTVQVLKLQLDTVLARSSAGDNMIAYSLGGTIGRLDSSSASWLQARPAYMRIANELSMTRRFAPAGVVVAGDSVTVSWRWLGPSPARWDVPGAYIGFTLRARITTGAGAESASLLFVVDRPYMGKEGSGGVPDIAAAAVQTGVLIQGYLQGVRTAPNFVTQRNGVVRADGDFLRLVVRGDVAAALREAHPQTAQFGLLPCGAVVGPLCESPWIAIDYR